MCSLAKIRYCLANSFLFQNLYLKIEKLKPGGLLRAFLGMVKRHLIKYVLRTPPTQFSAQFRRAVLRNKRY